MGEQRPMCVEHVEVQLRLSVDEVLLVPTFRCRTASAVASRELRRLCCLHLAVVGVVGLTGLDLGHGPGAGDVHGNLDPREMVRARPVVVRVADQNDPLSRRIGRRRVRPG